MIVSRICAVNRKLYLRKELFRIVRVKKEKIIIDLYYNIDGRGCYLLKDESTILKAKKMNILKRSFKCDVDISIYDQLLDVLNGGAIDGK